MVLEERLAQTFCGARRAAFQLARGSSHRVPQPGDALLRYVTIHGPGCTTEHAGHRSNPHLRRTFRAKPPAHAHPHTLRFWVANALPRLGKERESATCSFVAVESVYRMGGTVVPLGELLDIMWVKSLLRGTRTWSLMRRMRRGDMGRQRRRGIVAMLGLEDRVLALLHMLGKARGAASGACSLDGSMHVITSFDSLTQY